MKAQGRGERGAALVEFAIVLPVLVMLVLGAIDWGYFFYVQDILVNAAREGARAGAIGTDGDGVAAAKTFMTGALPAAQMTRCQDPVPTDIMVGGVAAGVRIDVTCDVGSISGVTKIPPFNWVMPAQAKGRVEMRR